MRAIFLRDMLVWLFSSACRNAPRRDGRRLEKLSGAIGPSRVTIKPNFQLRSRAAAGRRRAGIKNHRSLTAFH
jgi:hypothetical protein